MTSDEARSVLAEARDTLERVRGVKVERRDYSGEYWERPKPLPAPTSRPRSSSAEEINHLRSQDWARFVDSRIENVIAPLREAIGQCMGLERKAFRAEIDKLKSEYDLRISALLAEIEKRRNVDADVRSVVELPFIRRTHHDAA